MKKLLKQTMSGSLSYMKKLISLIAILSLSHTTFSQSDPIPKKRTAPTYKGDPVKLEKFIPEINIPANQNTINLRRFHFTYSRQNGFHKDYLQKKYWVQFKFPQNATIIHTCGTKPLRKDASGEVIKPSTQCFFFSPSLVVRNKNKGTTKTYPLNTNKYFSYQIELNGSAEYEIILQQTFPSEAELRSNEWLRAILGMNIDSKNEVEIQAQLESKMNNLIAENKNYLGKRVNEVIYKFSANYDFLVAVMGDSFMAGEGNPMVCGKDLPSGSGGGGVIGGVVETFTEVTGDVKELIQNGLETTWSGVSNRNFGDILIGTFTLTSGIVFLAPVVEQIIGACTIPELNFANLTAPNFDVSPKWIENGENSDKLKTSRSYINGTAQAAFALESKYPGLAVSYMTYATSGATSENLYQSKQHAYQKGTQVEEIYKNLEGTQRKIDALILGIGANDISFSQDMADLITDDIKDLSFLYPSPIVWVVAAKKLGSPSAVKSRVLNALKEFDNKFNALNQKIQSSVHKPEKIFVLEYPNAMFSYFDNGQVKIKGGCGALSRGPLNISKSDAELMTELGDSLNTTLKRLAAKYNWEYISGITEDFKGHGYCAPDTYYRSFEESCSCQGNYQGILHVNGKGYQKIANRIQQKLEQSFDFVKLSKPKPSFNDPTKGK